MGLDISAYSKMKLMENPSLDDEGYFDEYEGTQIWTNDDFPGREAPFIDRGVYTYDDYVGFRAGSYGGYNYWRQSLASLFGYTKPDGTVNWDNLPEEGPFIELINFSDCEGTLGTVVCKKLLHDFEMYDNLASQTKFDEDGYWYSKYVEWNEAFHLASDDGAVCFH